MCAVHWSPKVMLKFVYERAVVVGRGVMRGGYYPTWAMLFIWCEVGILLLSWRNSLAHW